MTHSGHAGTFDFRLDGGCWGDSWLPHPQSDPPDAPRPFAPFAPVVGVILWCFSALAFDLLAVLRQIFFERRQTDLRSSRVDVRRIFEFAREFAHLVPGQNRAVELWPVLVESNPIGQAGQQSFRDIAAFDGLLHNGMELSLQSGSADGMLGDQPSRAATFQPDKREAGSAIGIDDLVEPFGVLLVNSLHLLGVVAVELSGGEQTRARFAVSFCHRQQLVEQLLIHVPSCAPSTPLV